MDSFNHHTRLPLCYLLGLNDNSQRDKRRCNKGHADLSLLNSRTGDPPPTTTPPQPSCWHRMYDKEGRNQSNDKPPPEIHQRTGRKEFNCRKSNYNKVIKGDQRHQSVDCRGWKDNDEKVTEKHSNVLKLYIRERIKSLAQGQIVALK